MATTGRPQNIPNFSYGGTRRNTVPHIYHHLSEFIEANLLFKKASSETAGPETLPLTARQFWHVTLSAIASKKPWTPFFLEQLSNVLGRESTVAPGSGLAITQ